jgi:hypothetical protein
MTTFAELFRLTVTHTYYDTNCLDFEVVWPSDGIAALNRGRMRARQIDGVLYLVCETNDAGAPLVPVAAMRLRFGMRLTNPYFANFTDLPATFPSTAKVFRIEDEDLISGWDYPLVGNAFTHTLTDAARPVTVTLFDSLGHEVTNPTAQQTRTITPAGTTTAAFDATGWGPGLFRVQEDFPSATNQTWYYIDNEMKAMGVTNIFDVYLDGDPANPQVYTVDYAAKEQVQRYYIVASNYPTLEFDSITIDDLGYTTDGRSQIFFEKVLPAGFGPDEIPASMLAIPDEQLVIFRTKSATNTPSFPIARRDRGRSKIQLSNSADLSIANLPHPGPEKSNADFIIRVAMP